MVRLGIPGQNVDSLAYRDNRLSVVPLIESPRRPTVKDKKFPMWCEWRTTKNSQSPVEEGEFYKLISFQSNGDATWIQIASGGEFLNELSPLSLNQGVEYFSHCNEEPDKNYAVALANSLLENANTLDVTQAEHPGQWRFRLQGNNNAYATLQDSGEIGEKPYLLGGGTWVYEVLFNLQVLSEEAPSNEYIFQWGLFNHIDNEALTDGVVWEYDRLNSLNYTGVTISGSTRTEVDSGVVVTVGDWVTLRFEINADASLVEFFVNGTSVGTSTTNIPTTTLQMMIRGIKSNTSSNINVVYLDYVYLRNQLTTEI